METLPPNAEGPRRPCPCGVCAGLTHRSVSAPMPSPAEVSIPFGPAPVGVVAPLPALVPPRASLPLSGRPHRHKGAGRP